MEAARTGIEYCTYMARWRPNGRKAPIGDGTTDGLVQLKTKHAAAAEAGNYRETRSEDSAAE